jgi:hypothetical protein
VLSGDGDGARAGFEAGLGNGGELLGLFGKVAARNLEICEELFEPTVVCADMLLPVLCR